MTDTQNRTSHRHRRRTGRTLQTWGCGPFNNDAALDWVKERLLTSRSISVLDDALARSSSQRAHINTLEIGMAAAAVVAALRGHPSVGLPRNVLRWVAKVRTTDQEVAVLASRALDLVDTATQGTELQTYWEKSDEHELWLDDVNALTERLQAPAERRPKPRNFFVRTLIDLGLITAFVFFSFPWTQRNYELLQDRLDRNR